MMMMPVVSASCFVIIIKMFGSYLIYKGNLTVLYI